MRLVKTGIKEADVYKTRKHGVASGQNESASGLEGRVYILMC